MILTNFKADAMYKTCSITYFVICIFCSGKLLKQPAKVYFRSYTAEYIRRLAKVVPSMILF